jgi:hypothetical protein
VAIASFKRLALNEHLLDLFIDLFELEPTLIKSHVNYRKLLDYGAIASQNCPESCLKGYEG